MRKRKTIKCGEFLYKDGVVIKRPGKKFRAPALPDKLRIPYPEGLGEGMAYFPAFPFSLGDEYEDIDQMNCMREHTFQKKYKALRSRLRKLYYMGQMVACVRKVCRRITRKKVPLETVIDIMEQQTVRQR